MAARFGLFDVDERLKRLNDLGDQLPVFAGAGDFEIFRADLMAALGYCDTRPFDGRFFHCHETRRQQVFD